MTSKLDLWHFGRVLCLGIGEPHWTSEVGHAKPVRLDYRHSEDELLNFFIFQ